MRKEVGEKPIIISSKQSQHFFRSRKSVNLFQQQPPGEISGVFSARKHIGAGDRRCAMRVSRGSHATPFDEEVYGS